jgi:hypothetical protein
MNNEMKGDHPMRISKVEVQQVFNTGNYENIRFSAEASVGEDEDAGAVTSELRAFVAAQHQVFIAEREAQRAAERAVFEAEQAQRRAAWEAVFEADRPSTCAVLGCQQPPTTLQVGPPTRWICPDHAAAELADARAAAATRNR